MESCPCTAGRTHRGACTVDVLNLDPPKLTRVLEELQSRKRKYAAKHRFLPPKMVYLKNHMDYTEETIGNNRGVFNFLGLYP